METDATRDENTRCRKRVLIQVKGNHGNIKNANSSA